MNGEVWLAALGGLILGWLGRALVAARARDVGAATQTIELLRIESEAHLRALEEARANGDRSAVRRNLAVAESSALADRVVELESVVAEIEDRRREGRALSAERARLAERLEQLTLQYHRLESERTRSVLMADAVESQLKQLAESAQASRSLQATELLDVKRHLAGAVAEADQFRRELAALQAELGSGPRAGRAGRAASPATGGSRGPDPITRRRARRGHPELYSTGAGVGHAAG
ncbi:MAG: hypothetical protein EXR94_06285 [Gemmatimonadetes bacterium]|nr:hypothetical protein [Gemmatimonadota bacterium]